MPIETILNRLERMSGLDMFGRKLGRVYTKVVRPGRVRDVLSGTFMRHPAHPALTDMTIGAWTSAIVLDMFGARRGSEILVGVGALSAVPTAITGLNDLSDITDNQTRSVAVAHAAGNVASLSLFVASYFARRSGAHRRGVALAWTGFAVLNAAGYLGGHLSFRRGVGVNQTAFDDPIRSWTPVLDAGELHDEKPVRVGVDGTDVMLYGSRGKIYALSNRCTHRGGPLHKGKIADGCVTCPWHLSVFRIDDGEIVRGPAIAPAVTFETRIHEGKIEVRSHD
ncbi:MAG: Rieske 2Fe-2S domain-containing protein [Actinomycetota bacterium]|nr:Rieske 2Fe-2S domain-containing protein [Actinomycetota bacterium]